MTEVTTYEPASVALTSTPDPTGGRLVAWAEAAAAAHRLARALSQTAFVPQAMRNEGDATAAILMGDELGLGPLASLRSIYVVHGTPALYARAMVALALSRGHDIWTESSTDQAVTVCGRRRGSEHVERAEWTIQRATKAGYTTNRKYASNPQEMLYSKAAAEIARKVAPDVLAAIPYSVEDIELEQPATTTVTRAPAPRSRVSRKHAPVPEPEAPMIEPEPEPEPEPVEPMTDHSRREMFALLTERGITDADAQRAGMSRIIGRQVTSRGSLTEDEARAVIASLRGGPTPESAEPTPAEDWPEAAGDE